MLDSDLFSGGSERGGVFTGIGAKNITREPTQNHPTCPMVRERALQSCGIYSGAHTESQARASKAPLYSQEWLHGSCFS